MARDGEDLYISTLSTGPPKKINYFTVSQISDKYLDVHSFRKGLWGEAMSLFNPFQRVRGMFFMGFTHEQCLFPRMIE